MKPAKLSIVKRQFLSTKTLIHHHHLFYLFLPFLLFIVITIQSQPHLRAMSEVQSRPAPRGRGSARGGRGGFSSRGGRGGRGHTTNGDKLHQDSDISASTEDDGEIAQLKKTFGSKVTTIKDMFPDWTDEDIVLALQETNGDLETTVDGIASGMLPLSRVIVRHLACHCRGFF